MHIFSLKPKTHADFLKQERKDPITGDAFKTGDEVVFYAACRSAFLRESWEFMEGKHCNQKRTLVEFPKAQKNLALVHKKQQLYPKPLNLKMKFKVGAVIFSISAALSFFISSFIYESPLFFSGVALSVYFWRSMNDEVPRHIKRPYLFRFIRLNSRTIHYAKFGIPRRLRLSTLKHLYVTHELVGYINAKRHYFTFTFHFPEKKRSVQVEVTNEEHNDMLEALVLLSKQTAVTVGVRYQREYDFLTAKKEEYQAPIEIEILD